MFLFERQLTKKVFFYILFLFLITSLFDLKYIFYVYQYRLMRDIIIPDQQMDLCQVVQEEVLALNQEEDFQACPVDIHLALEDLENQEGRVVIHQVRQDFQVHNQVGNQVGNLDFHLVKALPVDTLVDDLPSHFRAVNQQADLVQEQVGIHLDQVHQRDLVHQEDFQQGQAQDILVAGLVGKHQAVFQVGKDLLDIRVMDNQKLQAILVHDRAGKDQAEDIPNRFLEAIPVECRSLVAQKVDILVEDQAVAIQEVLRDLAVVQVLRDQVDIQDRVALEVQVDHLPAVTLVLNQEDRDQKAIRVAQVHLA